MIRSSEPAVRNPVLALPAAQRLASLSLESRVTLRALLFELSHEADVKADHAWRTHKPPMAAYWKAVAVYARHIAYAIPRGEVSK